MVRTQITNLVERGQPRNKDCIGNAIDCRHRLLHRCFDAAKEGEKIAECHQFTRHPERRVRFRRIFREEVADKILPAPSSFLANTLEKITVIIHIQSRKHGTVEVAEGAVFQRVLADDLGANGDLYALNRVQHEKPELTVESIAEPNHFERGAGFKGVVRLLKRMPVCTKPVVADGFQLFDDGVLVWRDKSPVQKLVGLIGDGGGWLGIFHLVAGPFWKIKNPPRLRMLRRAEAWRVC